jgi:hypothetical protein
MNKLLGLNIAGTLLFFVCTFALTTSLAAQPSNPKPDQAAKGKIDVCALLTSADIQAAQGEPVKDTKPSTQPGGDMVISQCLFNTNTFAKSVTLALVLPDPTKPSALGPRKFWQRQFHSAANAKEKESADKRNEDKQESEREKELRQARAISGIGDEAFWVGNPFTGALYVLRGDRFVRLSVGGIRDESTRIAKSKLLAQAVLRRLAAEK